MSKYRIHFTDNYGQATIEAESIEQKNEILANLQADPTAEDIWLEYFDPEEGWQG